jgi:hypothetical protein
LHRARRPRPTRRQLHRSGMQVHQIVHVIHPVGARYGRCTCVLLRSCPSCLHRRP